MARSTEIAATPRPWVRGPRDPTSVYSDDSTGLIVATCGDFAWSLRLKDEQFANAALIVRAVNAYDELVAALRQLLDQLDATGGVWHPGIGKSVNQARAALAKSEGRQL